MTKAKKPDAVAAARERLKEWSVFISSDEFDAGINAFETEIRAECGKREAALLRAIGRAIELLRNTTGENVGSVVTLLQRAQRRARGVKRCTS